MTTASKSAAVTSSTRKIVHRTRGSGHGQFVRLMSPSDLGEQLKPFVFLDLFSGDMRKLSEGMRLHPHSGIATITVFTEGDVVFEDPQAGTGTIGFGGVEWMRASGGVWHGKELSAGKSAMMQGFQLWIALPPELENCEVDSQYIEADKIPRVGPAHLILGGDHDAQSPVRSPEGISYLLIRLKPRETWTFNPQANHTVAWAAVSNGSVSGDVEIAQGEMVMFANGEAAISFEGGDRGATFVLGSAVAHPHPLHLGYYSVHTSAAALVEGERRIAEIAERMRKDHPVATVSGSVPVYR